jgi:hypothetical protein
VFVFEAHPWRREFNPFMPDGEDVFVYEVHPWRRGLNPFMSDGEGAKSIKFFLIEVGEVRETSTYWKQKK